MNDRNIASQHLLFQIEIPVINTLLLLHFPVFITDTQSYAFSTLKKYKKNYLFIFKNYQKTDLIRAAVTCAGHFTT